MLLVASLEQAGKGYEVVACLIVCNWLKVQSDGTAVRHNDALPVVLKLQTPAQPVGKDGLYVSVQQPWRDLQTQ